VAPDPARGRVTEYRPTKVEKKKTKGVEESVVQIHNHQKIVGQPWQFLYETATKYIMYGDASLLYGDMEDEADTLEIFTDYCVKHGFSLAQLGIHEKTETDETEKKEEEKVEEKEVNDDEKSTDTKEDEEEELQPCNANHGDWKTYKEESLPSWCAPNSFYGGKNCANCEKEFVQKVEDEKKGKSCR
jgi:hypothetical protein